MYHLFGLFWIGNWILALGECVLAGAFATYYWTFDKKVNTLYTLTSLCYNDCIVGCTIICSV